MAFFKCPQVVLLDIKIDRCNAVYTREGRERAKNVPGEISQMDDPRLELRRGREREREEKNQ